MVMYSNPIHNKGLRMIPVKKFSTTGRPGKGISAFFECVDALFPDFPHRINKGMNRLMYEGFEVSFGIADFPHFFIDWETRHGAMGDAMWGNRKEGMLRQTLKIRGRNKSWSTDFAANNSEEKRNTVLFGSGCEVSRTVNPAIITGHKPNVTMRKASCCIGAQKILCIHHYCASCITNACHGTHMCFKSLWRDRQVTSRGRIIGIIITNIVIHKDAHTWIRDTNMLHMMRENDRCNLNNLCSQCVSICQGWIQHQNTSPES